MSSSDAVSVDFDVEAWAHGALKAISDGSRDLTAALEELRPAFHGTDVEQEKAMEKIVCLVLKMDSTLIGQEQVSLLLHFLTARLDSSGLAATNALQAVRHLSLECSQTNGEAALVVWRALFLEGNMQAWSVAQRLIMYELLEWLCTKVKKVTIPLGSEFVMSFHKSIGGERDPRCLHHAFRLFALVARDWQMGPFVEEMFETVACYYPVQFRPKDGDFITREALSDECEACLTAHPGFAPFCFMMIEEKLTDEEETIETRGEVCAFLTRAARAFPAKTLLPHMDALLSSLRALTFDPNDKQAVNVERAKEAMAAFCEKLLEAGPEHIEKAAKITMDNIEPFVLQAEMGLSLRAFALLECLCPGTTSTSTVAASHARTVASRSLGWAINLVQGETVNTAANRADVARDGLKALQQWVRVASRVGAEDVLLGLEDTLFSAIEAAREFIPTEALSAAYECARVMVAIPSGSNERKEEGEKAMGNIQEGGRGEREARFSELLRRGLYSIQQEKESSVYLSYVTAHSRARWDAHVAVVEESMALEDEVDEFARKRLSVLCASVYDGRSWERMRGRIWQEAQGLELATADELLAFASSDRGKEVGVERLAGEYREHVGECTTPELRTLAAHPEVWQRWGTVVGASFHKQLVDGVVTELEEGAKGGDELRERTAVLAELFHLLVIQAEDDSFLYRLISLVVTSSPSLPVSAPLRRALYFARVNGAGEESMEALSLMQQVQDDPEEQLRLRIEAAKAMLIASGTGQGVAAVEELLSSLSSLPSSSSSFLLTALLDFSSPLYDAERNGLQCTPLWRQRIAYQIVPVFERHLNGNKDSGKEEEEGKRREWRLVLLSALRHILALRVEGDEKAAAGLLAPFLPSIVDSLLELSSSECPPPPSSSSIPDGPPSSDGGPPTDGRPPNATPISSLTPFLVDALKELLQQTERERLSKELVARVVQAVCVLLEKEETSVSVTQSAVSCLKVLTATAAPSTLQPSISRAVRGLTKATGHRKRAVRMAAADAKNRWELLSTK